MAFKFNGTEVVTPYYFKARLIDGDGEGSRRNANWSLIRERKRARMRKLFYRFRHISSADTKTLLEALADESFTVEYPDPYTGTDRTITVMVGDRESVLSTYIAGVPVWGEITFNCIEY